MLSSIFTIVGISFGRIGIVVLIVSIISIVVFINIPNRSVILFDSVMFSRISSS